ncbi:hypothetical protein [Natrinema longum]|uniref:DUF8106 domain-containing protein n=1 Tax=Natrinema longum TaxID=370324 RepID=A0A8A2U9T0_9EURY|nr:hypothetical protein [Natrinema longum]MBZ6496580.1 hypothetical protein [Natrinema longum]QSW85519.1 hypothetical protein J0X27_01345 [Natrinema longum]
MNAISSPLEGVSSRKATLHCFECGHESPIGGDWLVRAHDDRLEYECPDCQTTIDSRPTSADSTPKRTETLCC